ncbi:MAG: hypothetical protein HKN43_15910 [Rhodothermales bacterium]|nr:hypothetical protein [Rhodothermales bacterium]
MTKRIMNVSIFKSLCAIAVVALFMVQDLTAQSVRAGSVYSRFGIGEIQAFHSSQAAGMGGGGYALSSGRYKTFANPASWSNQLLTGVAGGLSYEGLTIDDGSSDVSRVGSGSLNSIQFGFPIKERRIGVGLSFAPFTRVGYDIRLLDQLDGSTATGDSANYTIDYLGNGGLHSFTSGLGFAVGERLSFGISSDFIFGLLEESRETNFVDPSFSPTRLTQATRLSGLRATIGAQGNLSNVAKDGDRLTAGITFTTPTTLNGNRTNVFGTTQDRDTLGTSIDASVSLPIGFAAGLGYTVDSRWVLVSDLVYQPWTNFESQTSLPGYTPGSTVGLRDRIRLSAGAEVLPAGRDVFAPYWERVAYRLGFFYDQGYISPDGVNDVNTIGITAGLSVPMGVPGTRVDITTEVGRRGQTQNGLVRDTFFKFGLNLNIGERWFVKRKLG